MNKSSVSRNTSKRFGKVSEDDAQWLAQQHDCVKTLWFEIITVDPFGDPDGKEFKPFATSLKEKSFLRARKALTARGLFEFDYRQSPRDRRVTKEWLVRNLHGSETDYWKIDSHESPSISKIEANPKIDGHTSLSIGHESPSIGHRSLSNGHESPPISSETLSLSKPCSSLDLIRSNKIEQDLTILSSEKRSGRFVGSSPLGGEAAYTSDASIEEKTESGATHQSEDLGRSELCHTSSESENVDSREEAGSGHQPKNSAPPHTVSPQSTSNSNENDQQQDSAAPNEQTDSVASEQASTALPGATKPLLFDKVFEEAVRAAIEKGISYPDEFWECFLKAGRANQLAPVRLGLEKMGANLDDYIDSFLGDYIFHDASSGNPVYCANTTMKLKVWTH